MATKNETKADRPRPCAFRSLGNDFCEDAQKRISELREELNRAEIAYKICLINKENEYRSEIERLEDKYREQLTKNLSKQCRINTLQNLLSIKSFELKVNGKKYNKLTAIDKVRMFINDENSARNKKILDLEDQISKLQWKFYENCKEACKYKQSFEEIKESKETVMEKIAKEADFILNSEACDTQEKALEAVKRIKNLCGGEG